MLSVAHLSADVHMFVDVEEEAEATVTIAHTVHALHLGGELLLLEAGDCQSTVSTGFVGGEDGSHGFFMGREKAPDCNAWSVSSRNSSSMSWIGV